MMLEAISFDLLVQILTLIIYGGIVSCIVGAILKWYFDKKTKMLEVYLGVVDVLKDHAFRYYSPIANFSTGFAESLSRVMADPSDENKQYAFFSLSKLVGKMFQLREETGGVIRLQSYLDEQVAIELYLRGFRNLPFTRKHLGVLQRYGMLKYDFATFAEKLAGDNKILEVYERFSQWLQNKEKVDDVRKNMFCHGEFIKFQLNEMFKVSYKEKTMPPLEKECAQYINKIRVQKRKELQVNS